MSRRYARLEQARTLAAAQGRLAQGHSQRAVTEELGVARASLQDWLQEAPSDDVPAALEQFYATEEGVQWLHRQVLAAHLVIGLLAGAGIRQVCTFPELSGLSTFVASAYGSQHTLNVALEQAVVAYAGQQRDTLAAQMPQRHISVCEDEIEPPEICLVAIAPVSNFILRACPAPDRSAAIWTQAPIFDQLVKATDPPPRPARKRPRPPCVAYLEPVAA